MGQSLPPWLTTLSKHSHLLSPTAVSILLFSDSSRTPESFHLPLSGLDEQVQDTEVSIQASESPPCLFCDQQVRGGTDPVDLRTAIYPAHQELMQRLKKGLLPLESKW